MITTDVFDGNDWEFGALCTGYIAASASRNLYVQLKLIIFGHSILLFRL
jgi:hypothetical protein